MRLTRFRLRRHVALAALAGTTVLGACGPFDDPPAATVEGRTISSDALLDEVGQLADTGPLREQYEAQGLRLMGAVEGAYDAGFVASTLQTRIYLALIEEELEARGIELTDDDVAAARERVAAQLAGAAGDDGLSDEFLDAQARQEAAVSALGQELVGDDPQAYFEANPGAFAEVCVSHIYLSPQERGPEDAQAQAEQLLGRLESGEATFEELAGSESDDPESAAEGGDLGCGPASQYIPDFVAGFSDLEEGEVSEVVETQAGLHIIRLDERQEPAYEDVEEQVGAALSQAVGPAITEFLTDASTDADVEVNPRFGTWEVQEGAPGQVAPPSGPAPQG